MNIFGWLWSGVQWVKALGDSDGHLQVDVKTAPTLTVQATGSDKIFAIESVVAHSVEITVIPGQTFFNGTVVPTDKIWVLHWISILLANRAPTSLLFSYNHDGGLVRLEYEFRTLAAGYQYGIARTIYLDAGDYVSIYLTGASTGDTVLLFYGGYQMDA